MMIKTLFIYIKKYRNNASAVILIIFEIY